MNPVQTILVLAVLVCTAGCAITESEGPAVDVATDRTVYDLSDHEVVRFTAENRSDETVYYSGCTDLSVEQMEGTSPVDTLDVVQCDCVCSTELAPGASTEFTLPLVPDVDSIWFESGKRYRIGVGFHENPQLSLPLEGLSFVYSNAFSIRN